MTHPSEGLSPASRLATATTVAWLVSVTIRFAPSQKKTLAVNVTQIYNRAEVNSIDDPATMQHGKL